MERRIPISMKILRRIALAGREINVKELLSQISTTPNRLKAHIQWLRRKGFINKRTEVFNVFPIRKEVYVKITGRGKHAVNWVFGKRKKEEQEEEQENGNT